MDTQQRRRVGLLYDDLMLAHLPPDGHPERPERVQAVVERLHETGLWARVIHLPVIGATRAQIERVHNAQYLDWVKTVVAAGGGLLDGGDTVASAGSWDAVTAASGAAIGAVDAVMRGAVDAAFAVVRPPGHHAPPDKAMGFCILNHAAIAAAHAIAEHGLSRVLLVDFDVHHGNGTQDTFYASPHVLYFSTHQSPAYPFTGAMDETGTGDGAGFTVNVPLPPDVDDAGFVRVFEEVLTPLAAQFQPQMIIASAGYDAHWRNRAYVQGIRERMTVTGLTRLSSCLLALADTQCPGKLVGILEGGYDLDSLARGVCGTIGAWLGDWTEEDTIGPPPDAVPAPVLSPIIERVRQIHGL